MSRTTPQPFPYGGTLPYEPCTRCGKGDSTRVVVANGDPTWLVGALMVITEMTGEEATAMVEHAWDQLGGGERRSMCVRLCRGCGADLARRMPDLPIHDSDALRDGDLLCGLGQPS